MNSGDNPTLSHHLLHRNIWEFLNFIWKRAGTFKYTINILDRGLDEPSLYHRLPWANFNQTDQQLRRVKTYQFWYSLTDAIAASTLTSSGAAIATPNHAQSKIREAIVAY